MTDGFVRVSEKQKKFGSKELHKASFCSELVTIFSSVVNLHKKKIFEYRIGVSTIFLVTAFITVLIANSSFTDHMFLQNAQSIMYETDFIVRPE